VLVFSDEFLDLVGQGLDSASHAGLSAMRARRCVLAWPTTMSDTPTQIGPYAIERRLGAGGMAETFVAVRRMQSIEQRVCLKRILPAYAANETARKLFQREANITAKLRHANIVQVLDVGEDRGTPYLVMELVEGSDLDHVLERLPDKRMAPELVGYVLSEIAHGLQEAHGGDGAHDGVVHRDLSPSNVLLSTSGEVKVADFGIAKALSGDKATATSMRGKFAYMSPEQLDGEPLDPRVDMWALGVMAYEMLAGVRPFDADADGVLLMSITKGSRRSIREHVPTAPRELLDTIEALLARDKSQRPVSGHAVVERLAPMLPSSVLARRQLGKLVTAAYEARLAAITTVPATNPRSDDPALAATSMAPAPATRPAPRAAPAGTPMAVTALPTQDATAARGDAPRPAGPNGAVIGVAVAAITLLGAVAIGYAFLGGGPAEAPAVAAIAPSTAPTTVAAGAPPTTVAPVPTAPPTSAPSIASTPPTTTEPTTTTAPPAPAPTTTERRATHGARPSSDPPPTSAATASADDGHDGAGRGHLHIVVSPWGNVWIDGIFQGRSPVDATLRAGSHRIEAGTDEPTTRRTVRVRAGTDERVDLEVGG
jgi:serine/threonine-protein kinase